MPLPAGPKAKNSIKEFDLIQSLRHDHGTENGAIFRGIGDDAAVVIPPADSWQLLTTDLLAEHIHFDLHHMSLFDVGFRAATANLSDIAAMGGTPQYLLTALAIPRTGTRTMVQQLYRGLMAACRPHQVRLIGGDTSASIAGWFIGITLVGSARPHRALLRSGAHAGDDLYVTGTLGDSLAGLKLLRARRTPRSLLTSHRQFLIDRHLHPTARVKEGRWLSSGRWASSAIDISDGLSGDIRHICEESHVGAKIDLAALPLSKACRAYAAATRQDATALALAGGEDFELLFTVPPRHRLRFKQSAAAHPIRITRIGTITPAKSGIQAALPNGRHRPLPLTSYEHFRST